MDSDAVVWTSPVMMAQSVMPKSGSHLARDAEAREKGETTHDEQTAV